MDFEEKEDHKLVECCGEILLEPFYWTCKEVRNSIGCVREWEYYRCPKCDGIKKVKIENWWEEK